MKRLLIIGSIVIAIVLGILLFSAVYEPTVQTATVITPSPVPVTPEPTPSPTPEIKIQENAESENISFVEFHSLLNITTSSQYNYAMTSITEYFDALYQINLRNYSFEKFTLQYDDLLSNRFAFESNEESLIPFNRFNEAFIDDEQEYKLILDASTITIGDKDYSFSASLFVNDTETAVFDFSVNKNTMEIFIK